MSSRATRDVSLRAERERGILVFHSAFAWLENLLFNTKIPRLALTRKARSVEQTEIPRGPAPQQTKFGFAGNP